MFWVMNLWWVFHGGCFTCGSGVVFVVGARCLPFGGGFVLVLVVCFCLWLFSLCFGGRVVVVFGGGGVIGFVMVVSFSFCWRWFVAWVLVLRPEPYTRNWENGARIWCFLFGDVVSERCARRAGVAGEPESQRHLLKARLSPRDSKVPTTCPGILNLKIGLEVQGPGNSSKRSSRQSHFLNKDF